MNFRRKTAEKIRILNSSLQDVMSHYECTSMIAAGDFNVNASVIHSNTDGLKCILPYNRRTTLAGRALDNIVVTDTFHETSYKLDPYCTLFSHIPLSSEIVVNFD